MSDDYDEAKEYYESAIKASNLRHQRLKCCETCKHFLYALYADDPDTCKLMDMEGWQFGEVKRTDICDWYWEELK